MTTKIEIPQWNSTKTPFKDWRTQLTEYFAASGDAELLDKSLKPTAETNYLPVASTPDAFITKCKDHAQAELLVRWTGLEKSSAQLRALKAEDGIRDVERSRGLGDVYKRQGVSPPLPKLPW